MMALQTLYPTNDKATLDAAHCFRCTSYTGRCDILTGAGRIKVDELLQIAEEKKLRPAPVKPIDTTPIKTTGGKINHDAYMAIMTEPWDFDRHTRDIIADAAKLAYQISDSDTRWRPWRKQSTGSYLQNVMLIMRFSVFRVGAGKPYRLESMQRQ